MYTSPLTYFQRLIYFFIFLVAVKTYPDCSQQNGDDSLYFSHKDDCNSFWKCSNGRPHLFNCPSTLHFNSELNVCDYPQNVRCITSTEDSSKTTATENTFISTTEQPSTTTTTQKISTTKSTKLVSICPAQSSTTKLPTSITQKITTPSVTVKILSTTTADTTPMASTTSSTTIEINSSDTEAESVTEHVTREIISTISDFTNAQTDTEDSTKIDTSTTNIVDLRSTTDIVDSSVTTNTPDETFKISSTSLTTISSPEDIITNSRTSTENMNYLCEPSSEYFFTAHPNSCFLYIACSFGTAHVLRCYDNKWFNSFTSTCVEPANSDCNKSRLIPIHIDTETESYLAPIDSLDFICDNEINETYKYHPFDCEKYVVCDHGYPVVMNCPKGLHFDLSLKQCVYSYESKCSLTS